MRLFIYPLAVALLTSALPAQQERTPGPKPFETLHSANGEAALELRGNEGIVPTEAWVVSVKHGRSFLASPETYIEGGGISQNGRYIALSYHVSSGGYGAAFVRQPDGGYRQFVNNGFALEQVKAGHVPGMSFSDLPQDHLRNIYCGIYLVHHPDRLLFPVSRELEFTYSLEQRRIRDGIVRCSHSRRWPWGPAFP